MSLNVNAQEFVPSFTSKPKTDRSTKKKQAAPINTIPPKPNNNQSTNIPNSKNESIQSFNTNNTNPYPIYPPQTMAQKQYINNNLNNQCNEYYNPYINNPNYNYYATSINPMDIKQQQESNEEFIKQQQEKQKQFLSIQRKTTLQQLIQLFPSIDSNKLETIFKTHAYNIKRSILYILQSNEFKGTFDKSICVYHLSNTCQFENNPDKCRYNHDREVPSAICQFWLNNTCIKDDQCQFIHRIPIKTKNQHSDIINNHTDDDNNNIFDIEELVLMLTAMFPQHKPVYLKKLLGQHAMKIKPVVATLLQGDDYSTDNNTVSTNANTNSNIEEAKNNNSNDRPVCRYYLMGDCKLLDCMFSHDIETANAVCKYWLWGYCSRGNKCIYKHNLPNVDRQQIINKQQQQEMVKQQSKQQAKQKQKVSVNRNKNKKAPSDLVAKLRLNLLKESFPNVPSKQLTNAFVANGYDLEITQKYLIQKYGKKPIDVINKQTANMNIGMNKGDNKRKGKNDEGLMQKIGWVETGENLNNLYKSTRNKAEEHARIRNQLFMKAVDAYLRGNRKLAKELSTKGREHDKEMHKLHKEAGNDIYDMRNKKLAVNVIDLHGLHVEEAINKLNDRISKIKKLLKNSKKRKNKKNKQQQNGSEYVLDILTGTGHHSFGGRAKLGPAIISYAKKKKIKHKKMNFVDGRGGNIRLFIE